MNTYGFTLVREQHLTEVGGVAKLWRHDVTGAELLSIVNADENKCFGVSFRTPPEDSTGVAHILEHSVLCGSERYPVKEPFVELLKGSLQTFLNAFTYPDKTCYPVASVNGKDFENLVNVYLDAVFFPRISESIFQQEGWHVESDEDDPQNGPLSYKGVVFNEMKGVYSSPDSVLAEASQQSIFPDNTYSLDSGGAPEAILKLTYDGFKLFHTTHYHPSNARFFFWGDFPEETRFALLAPYLSRFERRAAAPEIPLQKPLELPRHIEVAFAAEQGERRGHITLNWLLCDTADEEEITCLDILDHILLALPGSPLRKALIESGLGEDIAGGGLETDLRQSFYSVGLRSIDPENARDVELCVMDTLGALAEEGVPADAIEAALNSVEFSLRENNTGSFPRGLSAMLASLTTWLHNGDPLQPLAWEKPLATIKNRLKSGEKVFENAIRRWFLENSHQSTVLLLPDATLAERREADETARLLKLQKALSADERAALAVASKRLRESQQAPDSPEALATIPSLTLADLPRKGTSIHTELAKAGNCDVLLHDLDTTGVLYGQLLFPLNAVPQDLLPLLSLYSRGLTEMGTTHHDFVDLGTLMASRTGGLGLYPAFQTHENGTTLAHLVLSGKATLPRAADLFEIMSEILLEPAFDNAERFTQMLLEERARMEQSLVPGGHRVVSGRLSARHDLTAYLGELTGGVSYLEALRSLADRCSNDWASVRADLERLHSLIIRRDNAIFNFTANAPALKSATGLAEALASRLPSGVQPAAMWASAPLPRNEALLAPAQVNYVGQTCNLYKVGYNWHNSAQVISRHLRMAWLWDQVRVQGGAYGAFCSLDRISGGFSQVSYRDPNIEKTLNVYDASARYLRELALTPRDLTLAVVGALGDIDSYQLPDAKGRTALRRHLAGITDEKRQQLREEVLDTTPEHFRTFAAFLTEAGKQLDICALGGAALEAVATARSWEIKKLL